MSIALPGKPNWKITLDFDDRGQASILVEDRIIMPGKAIPRQLNQVELAMLLTNTVFSILQNTLKTIVEVEPEVYRSLAKRHK